MNIKQIINSASKALVRRMGHEFNQISIAKPASKFEALNLLKITSKLSPFVGNLFEIEAVETLTKMAVFNGNGLWVRQDPGFPDVLFKTGEPVEAGFEIKAWYPFSTEITGRFKDSQRRFAADQTYVLMFAWVPARMLFGRPKILDMVIVSARSVAAARDAHYHKPPGYLVVEPLDTSERTRNLQQTNTSGLKWQGTKAELEQAAKVVARWGKRGAAYKPTRDHQELLRGLTNTYSYRLDTNYGKMDRVVHPGIEAFKSRVMNTEVEGRIIAEWGRFFRRGKEAISTELEARFRIVAVPGEPPIYAAPAPSQSAESDDE